MIDPVCPPDREGIAGECICLAAVLAPELNGHRPIPRGKGSRIEHETRREVQHRQLIPDSARHGGEV
jgi:hypothetical protein